MDRPWLSLPSLHQPEYEDEESLQSTLNHLKSLPGFISNQQVEDLKSELTQASLGTSFILQIGDCAEPFADCTEEILQEKLSAYLGYKHLLQSSIKKPVVLIARVAGQFIKPRSEPFELVNGQRVPSYKGDMVNSASPSDRNPDPRRLIQAYECAEIGYKTIQNMPEKIFTSHEALHVRYEDCFTRETEKGLINLSAHFLWIGERTRKIGHAHAELLARIANPVGIKVGPGANLNELCEIIKKINPLNEEGKIVLILRLGVNNVQTQLAGIVNQVKNEDLKVVFMVDPVHANTFKTAQGVKTRRVDVVLQEIIKVEEGLRNEGCRLSGIHLESSYKFVTECIGVGVEEEGLTGCYETLCDPRLNADQTRFILTESSKLFGC